MESQDDGVVKEEEDVEMKYEINEDQKPNHESEEQQQCYHNEEPSKEIDTMPNTTNHDLHKTEINSDTFKPNELSDRDIALSSNKRNELKHVVEQEDEQITKEERSDIKQNIVPNSNHRDYERMEDIDGVKAADDDEDKMSDEKEKSIHGQDVSDDKPYDRLALMGRNRRVRQKNRYFLDFHCIDLTKGARSNKDDYEGFTTTTTGTRSSNRRSTTDSNRGQQDETDGIESRYCRKCSTKTMHDVDGGCQPCLYKKIVESSKRQRPSSQRGRSNTRHHYTKQQQQQQQQQNDNEVEASSTTTNISKRRANRQGGSKINGNNSNLASINSNINNISNTSTNAVLNNTDLSPIPNDESIVGDTPKETSVEKLPKLDSWTPDEVAEYIMSKGFTQEAELFKMQSVDGISLLLMQRTDFTYGLKIKLGPALKIYDQVCKLKKEYFRSVSATN